MKNNPKVEEEGKAEEEVFIKRVITINQEIKAKEQGGRNAQKDKR